MEHASPRRLAHDEAAGKQVAGLGPGMSQASTPLLTSRDGRPTKFTPERIEQIKNLVERGKSRAEIAEMLDVTVESLQVTCSRLGISLRRAVPKNGVALRPPSTEARYEKISTASRPPVGQDPQPQPQATTPHRARMESQQAGSATFTLRIKYKGRERAHKLSLSECVISHLALEAELRDMRIGELIDELIVATMKGGVLQPLLDGQDEASIRTYLANLPRDK
jgi:hypothetical protein